MPPQTPSMSSQAPREAGPGRSGRRPFGCFLTGLLGCGGFTVGALVAATVFAPRLLGGLAASLLESSLDSLTADSGRVELKGVDLAWTRSMQVRDLRLLDEDGGDVLRASLRLPSLLSLFDLEDPVRVKMDVQHLVLEQESDGRWNLERLLAPMADATWDVGGSGIEEFGVHRAFELELGSRGERVVRFQGQQLDLVDMNISAEANRKGLRLQADLEGELEGERFTIDTATTFHREHRGRITDGYSQLALDAPAGLPGGLLESFVPAELRSAELFGEVRELGAELEITSERKALVQARVQSQHGDLTLSGIWEEGMLRADYLGYEGSPGGLAREGWELPGGARLAVPPGEQLELSSFNARLALGPLSGEEGPDRGQLAHLRAFPLQVVDQAGRVLIQPREYTVQWSRSAESRRTEIESSPAHEDDLKLYLQLGETLNNGETAALEGAYSLLVHAERLPAEGLRPWTGGELSGADWTTRWLGPELSFDLELQDLGNGGGSLSLRAGGELGSLRTEADFEDGRLVDAGAEEAFVLEGRSRQLRHVALELLPVYRSITPRSEADQDGARIRLRGFRLPADWLGQEPSSWDWSEVQAEVQLEFGDLLLQQHEPLAEQLAMDFFEGRLDGTYLLDRERLSCPQLSLGIGGTVQTFQGELQLDRRRLDLVGQGPLPFVMQRLGRGSFAQLDALRALTMPLHLGGGIESPSIDLPLDMPSEAEQVVGALGSSLGGVFGDPARRVIMSTSGSMRGDGGQESTVIRLSPQDGLLHEVEAPPGAVLEVRELRRDQRRPSPPPADGGSDS